MTVLLQTNSLAQGGRPAAPEARSTSRRNGTPPPKEVRPEIANGLFDVALRASSAVSPAGLGAADPRWSPSLMFESADPDPRAAARAAGGDASRLGFERHDRTSVDARKSYIDSRAAGARVGNTDGGNVESMRSASSRDASSAESMNLKSTSSSGSRQLAAHDQSARRIQSPPGSNHSSSKGNVVASFAASPSPGIAGVSSGAQGAKSPAMLVGRLLATGQSIDAEGFRGGSNNGALASNTRSTTRDDASASRSQSARHLPGRGADSTGSTDRAKNPMFDQLVRSIRLSANIRQAGSVGRLSSARLQLNPPELGRINIEVSVENQRARIVVKTQSDAARSLVQERASELVTALEKHGIIVERLEIGTEIATDRQAGHFGELDEPGDRGATDQGMAHEARRNAGNSYADPNASEDGSLQQAGLDGHSVEPDDLWVESVWREGSGVAAEPRLDIRV